jgi:hypothetical protein
VDKRGRKKEYQHFNVGRTRIETQMKVEKNITYVKRQEGIAEVNVKVK